jgi:2-keto-4-pentenoate hydratase
MKVVDLKDLARRMLADYDAGAPGQVFAEPLDLTTAQAYALQAGIALLREQRGERVIGYKIGCTSSVIQRQLGMDQPIYGRVFDTGQVASGTRLAHAGYANLAVEGELAVRLATDLALSSLARDDSWELIDSIFPVIELHHYVLRSPRPCVQELIAGNGMHAGFVSNEHASKRPPVRIGNLALVISDGGRDECDQPWTMGGPMASLRWLATRLGESGIRLTRGQVILTGSPLPLRRVSPGSQVVVEAAPLGTCCVEVGP